jgi:hypothetical protein
MRERNPPSSRPIESLPMPNPPPRCPGPLSRRSFLKVGTLGLGGLGLSDLFRLRANAENPRTSDSETSVIFVWLPGGPPHMEMYDMKPNAPLDYRGLFNPIATNVPGLDVCELMPRHALCADKYNVIRFAVRASSLTSERLSNVDRLRPILRTRAKTRNRSAECREANTTFTATSVVKWWDVHFEFETLIFANHH